jgi:protein unc-45
MSQNTNTSSPSSKDGSSQDLHNLLLSIQQDPKRAAAALPSLSNAQLLSLFRLYVEDEDDESEKKVGLRSSAYLALSAFVSAIRNPVNVPSHGQKTTTTAAASQPPSEQADKEATRQLAAAFYPTVEDTIRETNSSQLVATLSFLSALLQIDSQTVASILGRTGNMECILDIIELASSLPSSAATTRLQRALASFLSQAIGNTQCRKLLLGVDDGKATTWLNGLVESKDARLRSTSALALVKLAQGKLLDEENSQSGIPAAVPSSQGAEDTSPEQLAGLLEKAILSDTPGVTALTNLGIILDSVEGLAYLSVHPVVRDHIASNSQLLKRLVSIGLATTKKTKPSTSFPSKSTSGTTANAKAEDPRVNVGLHYGLALLFANVAQYRPKLSKEQEQIAKLRRMTKPTPAKEGEGERPRKLQDEGEDPRTADKAVKARIKKLCAANLLSLLAGLARSDSRPARECTARVYLAIAEDQTNRGDILKNGGGKALMEVIKADPASSGSTPVNEMNHIPDWLAIQALSKLAITASPVQVFGPDRGATLDAIAPFARVITFADAVSAASYKSPLRISVDDNQLPTGLQKFEALMALTNIASVGAEMATRVVRAPQLINSIEGLLLDEHEMIRRAAMELICNLVVCDEGFERFVPNSNPKTTAAMVESRLQILVALADVEDFQTRKAASGALAMLSSDEKVCAALAALQKKRESLVGILGRLLIEIDEEEKNENEDKTSKSRAKIEEVRIANPELVHRGIVLLRNLVVQFIQKKKEGYQDLLRDMVREGVVGMVETVVKDALQRGAGKGDPVVENALEFVVALRGMGDAVQA